MALLLCTGFETIPPGSGNAYVRNLEAQGWTFYNQTWVQTAFPGGPTPGVAVGRYPNGQAIQIGYDTSTTGAILGGITRPISKTFGTMLTEGGLTFGFAVKFSTSGTTAPGVNLSIGLIDTTTNTPTATIALGNTSSFFYYRNASSSTVNVPFTNAVSLVDGAWHYVEVILDAQSGSSFIPMLSIDGNLSADTAPTVTTSATVLAQIPRFAFPKYDSTTATNTTTAKPVAYDDVYVMDRTGTVNNGLALGEIREYRRGPTTDVQAQWTRVGGAASNAATVNKRDFASTTEYIYPATSVVEDIYSSTDIISGLRVVAVNIEGFGFQDSGSQAITPVLKLTSEHEGSNVVMNATPTYFKTTFEQNPETSAAWTLSQANASQFGVKG